MSEDKQSTGSALMESFVMGSAFVLGVGMVALTVLGIFS